MPAPAPRPARRARLAHPASRIERAVLRERAKRRARIEHERERRLARRRFVALLFVLLFFTIFLGLTIWDQIQALFGL